MKTDSLITQLGDNLTPVKRLLQVRFWVPCWVLLSTAYVILMTLYLGSFRPGAWGQLLTAPRFALELSLGALAMLSATLVCLNSSIPGGLKTWMLWLQRGALMLWLAVFSSAFLNPPLAVSMLGKRDGCIWESFLLSAPPLLFLLLLTYRRYPMSHTSTAFHAALAAGLIPALTMQLACMYDPLHALKFHLLPVAYLAMATIVISLAWRSIRRLRSVAS